MSRFYKILSAILLIAVFSGSPVFSSESSEIEDSDNKVITGTLVKVDLKNQSIYVKENSRIVKFKASIDICQRFKDKINSEVDITYKIGNNKSLQIITIIIAEKKEETNTGAVKPKAPSKKKSEK